MRITSIAVCVGMVLTLTACSRSGETASVRASGTIEATEVNVAAQVTGQVRELRVDEGSDVQPGETLALIDRIAPSASVSQAKANLDLAQADARRVDALFASGSATKQEKDNADTRVAQAQAALVLAQKTLDNTYVISPLSGTVTSKAVEVGDLATPGAVIVSVSKLDTVKLTIYVSETELPKVKLGAAAEVRIDAASKQVFPGRVTFISPTAEFTPKNIQTREDRVKLVFGVRIEIPNPDGTLKPGLPADATIKVAPAEGMKAKG
ncbi:MAG TPA: efflux RND transporter periplasmic adaptor subunit [bacterium]|nr:efflux RND transporter periplasmic adaptor subunit [bacterium]